MTSDKKQGIWLVIIGINALCGLLINFTRDFDLIRFFSYFTIQSNFFVLLYIIITLTYMKTRTNRPFFWPATLGFTTLIINITGIVYLTLLKDFSPPYDAYWLANIQLYIVVPLAMLLYFIFVSAKVNLRYRLAAYWLLYPLIYMIISFIRGSKDGWYPYWFLDLTKQPLPTTIFWCLGLGVGFWLLGLLIIFINNRIKKA